jgi:D-arginine dehydrogenase
MVRRMDIHSFDIVVIGAGIAGATAAAQLATDHRVALVEAEEAAGYHTTGRSAALWILNYGPPDVQTFTGRSRAFFEAPPPGFTETPLMSPRRVAILAPASQVADLRRMVAEGTGLREIDISELARDVPALRPDYAVAAAVEDDAFDMDVAALHQGFLRQLRRAGGLLALRSRAGRIERRDGLWHVEVSTGDIFRARVVVNAAGAWGDEVAAAAGVAPVGLVAKRRTGAIVDPAPYRVTDWPMLMDAAGSWYCRAEARTKLMVSPADATPMHPHDVQPDELDIATAIDRMQQALTIEVRRVERAWSGLRTFTPDGSLAFGWDADAEGVFWCVGQGGYGIQTSPAAGRYVADVVSGRDPGLPAGIGEMLDPRRYRSAPLAPVANA